MSIAYSPAEIEYPESDGKPMGETDLHRLWMIRLYDLLKYRYRHERVYVGSDLLVYFTEGNPREFVVPDDFVVKDCDPGLRRVFKIWEEQRVPNVVFEVTSKKTRRKDQGFKPQTYAKIGVKELFLYDPTADYLRPPLAGYRLADDALLPISPSSDGSLDCQELGLLVRLEQGQLVLVDAQTGQPLLTEAEAEHAAREAAEARAMAAEAEIQRLRQQLESRSPPQ